MRTAAAYIRVSTDGQLEYSPDSQLKVIRDYAQKHDFLLPEAYIFREEEGISGKEAKKRPAFMRMIGIAKQKPKPFDCIILWKFSRFARSRRDSIVYKTMLRKQLGIDVVSVTEQLGDDKLSLLLEAVIEAMDEYYSINLAEEVKRGMLEKVSRGEPVTPPPFGYRMQEKQYILDPTTAPIVQWMFRLCAQGVPCNEIARRLNAMGIPTARGQRWETRAVAYLLHNPIYLGKIRWNLHPGTKQSPPAGPVLSDGMHQALVDPSLWEESQRQLNQKGCRRNKRAPQTAYPLRGLVFCSTCGAPLVKTSRDALQCSAYAHGLCSVSHYISMRKMEEWILCILEADLPPHTFERNPCPRADSSNPFQLQLEQERKKLERLRDAYEAGAESLEEYQREKARLQAHLTTLSAEAHRCHPLQEAPSAVNMGALLRDGQLSNEAKNRVLHAIFDRIVYDAEQNHLTVHYRIE